MPSVRERRKQKKTTAQRRRLQSCFLPPVTPKTFSKEKGNSFTAVALEPFAQKVLLEDVQKLSDPTFFPKDSTLALPPSLVNLFYHAGMRTVGNLCSKTESEFLETPGIGKGRFEKTKSALSALGLGFQT